MIIRKKNDWLGFQPRTSGQKIWVQNSLLTIRPEAVMLAPWYLTFYDLTMDFASTDFRRCLDVALDALGNCLWSVIIQSRCPFFVDCAFVPLLFIPVLLTFARGWGLRLILVLDLIVRRCSTFFSLLNIFGSWSLFTFVFDARFISASKGLIKKLGFSSPTSI